MCNSFIGNRTRKLGNANSKVIFRSNMLRDILPTSSFGRCHIITFFMDLGGLKISLYQKEESTNLTRDM